MSCAAPASRSLRPCSRFSRGRGVPGRVKPGTPSAEVQRRGPVRSVRGRSGHPVAGLPRPGTFRIVQRTPKSGGRVAVGLRECGRKGIREPVGAGQESIKETRPTSSLRRARRFLFKGRIASPGPKT